MYYFKCENSPHKYKNIRDMLKEPKELLVINEIFCRFILCSTNEQRKICVLFQVKLSHDPRDYSGDLEHFWKEQKVELIRGWLF